MSEITAVVCPSCSAPSGSLCTSGEPCAERVELAARPFPVSRPRETGFGPLDSDNSKEWNRDRRRWEAGERWDA